MIHESAKWTAAALGSSALACALYYVFSSLSYFREDDDKQRYDEEEDHPLLKDHSTIRSYTTDYATYPAVRTFYHAHPHAEKLQEIADLPLLIFLHGMGGSLAQFAPLMGSLVNIGPCFGLDLPGQGMSQFAPQDYQSYKIEASTELWKIAIQEICEQHGHKNIVLVGHSMGCSVGALLCNTSLSEQIEAFVAICPRGSPPSRSETAVFRRLLGLPDIILDVIRFLDKRGGTESKSVKRFVGEGAGLHLKQLQLKYNTHFATPVWKRIASGCLAEYDGQGNAHGGLPGLETWQNVKVPLFLIAGEADVVTKPEEVNRIAACLQGRWTSNVTNPPGNEPHVSENSTMNSNTRTKSEAFSDDRQYGVFPTTSEHSSKYATVVKTAVLPKPAAHALMYDHATYRTVAGLLEDFLARYVSPQLSLGWQLQQLTTSGKWDVKNLEKWKKVLPVSGPIDSGLFRALKTLREQDEEHTPLVFARNWRDKIFAVIDISHDLPIYDTKALDRNGIQYHKFPTVSKVPPTVNEVADFIALVDRLRHEQQQEEKTEANPQTTEFMAPAKAIAVHCHYGYNRTGFFIVCYLVERRKYTVQDALDEFAKHKPPGIKHDHFIDTLYMRYCVGLRRASTFVVTEES